MENGITVKEQAAILDAEIQRMNQERYLLVIRAKVAKEIKNDKQFESCQKGLEQLEAGLGVLNAERAKLADKGAA